jgi:hypothetical protein
MVLYHTFHLLHNSDILTPSVESIVSLIYFKDYSFAHYSFVDYNGLLKGLFNYWGGDPPNPPLPPAALPGGHCVELLVFVSNCVEPTLPTILKLI